ncbi:MAG: VCBS repeat-containing protein [Candidatus Latescibacteria bacterium]|nr:VCBS repeat-containing protein [Candidatus Latescibacterota bacterium]
MKQFLTFISIFILSTTTHAQLSFTDVTASTNVGNSDTQQRLATQATWGDYDGDNDLDLYITNWGSGVGPTVAVNRLYENNNGSFSDVANSAGVSDGAFRNSVDAHWIDFDNDGDLDLYVVEFDSQDQLYQNNGNGSFSNVTGRSGINVISQGDEQAATWGDYNKDGNIDLYICKVRFRNALYHNNGDGTFSEVGATAGVDDIRDTQDATWGDYDNDGNLDLYVVNREQNNALFKNSGTGFFEEIACALSIDNTDIGKSASWIDVDTDGDLDLFIANVGANALYQNNGANQFTNIATNDMKSISGAWVSWAGAWGDFDRDGDLDLFVANGADSRAGQVSPLLQNDGSGTFTNATPGSGLSTSPTSAISTVAADYDSDGDLDIYVINSRLLSFDANQLYRNNIVP